jgi:hypothetical protein
MYEKRHDYLVRNRKKVLCQVEQHPFYLALLARGLTYLILKFCNKLDLTMPRREIIMYDKETLT